MAKDENKKIKKENKNGLKNLKLELKKVVWPTPKQLANNTIAVITIVLITAVIVFGLDFAFEKANEYGVEKLKTSVESKKQTNVDKNSAEAKNDENNNPAEENENEEANADGNQPSETSENNDENNNQTENVNSEEQKAENQVED